MRNWLLSCLLVWLGLTGQVGAHAQLLGSAPLDGAVLDMPPDRLELIFSQPVRPIAARLTTAGGDTITLDPPQVTGATVRYRWPPDLGAQGSHLLSWRATASDGHPMAGGMRISIGHESGPNMPEPLPAGPVIATWAARAAVLAGLVFGIGASAVALTLGLGGLLVLAIARPLVLLGAGFDQLFTPGWWLTLSEPWQWAGSALMLVALLLCLGGRGVGVGARRIRLCAIAGSGVAGVILDSHLRDVAPLLPVRGALSLHVLAGLFWLGALVPLLRDLQAGRGDRLSAFTRLAPWAVAILLLSGMMLASIQIDRPASLWQTSWGQILLAKLTAVGGLLLLAAWNRWWLIPRGGARALLIGSIGAEIILGLAVIVLLSGWQFAPPPRLLPPPAIETSLVMTADTPSGVRIALHLQRQGRDFAVKAVTRDGLPFQPETARISLSRPAFGIGPFTHDLTRAQLIDGQHWPMIATDENPWVIDMTLGLSPFESLQITDLLLPPVR